jgi:hypothetical protein
MRRRLGNAEVNYLWKGMAITESDENIGRFEIAMDNSLLMCVPDAVTDSPEQIDSVTRGEPAAIAGSRR